VPHIESTVTMYSDRTPMPPNNAINSDSKKWRDEGATLFAAGYGERYTPKITLSFKFDVF